jgi:hypothetical protein
MKKSALSPWLTPSRRALKSPSGTTSKGDLDLASHPFWSASTYDMTYDPLQSNQQSISYISLGFTHLPILDTPTLLSFKSSALWIELLFPTLMAQHKGLST